MPFIIILYKPILLINVVPTVLILSTCSTLRIRYYFAYQQQHMTNVKYITIGAVASILAFGVLAIPGIASTAFAQSTEGGAAAGGGPTDGGVVGGMTGGAGGGMTGGNMTGGNMTGGN